MRTTHEWLKRVQVTAATAVMIVTALALPLQAATTPDTQAPGFTLTDQDAKVHRLSDYAGKTVVLEWFNPDCPFVKRHHEAGSTMVDLAKRYADKGVVWLAVNSTHYMDAKASKQWHDTWKLPYPVLIDRGGTVGRAYGATSTPHMVVIDTKGHIVYNGAIDNDPTGQLETPTNYVAQALDQLIAGKEITRAKTQPYGCSVKYAPKTVHDFTMTDIDDKPVKLESYKGKVLLVVNVASKCGATPQYKDLQALYAKYKDQGLVVLGFPANNFKEQEPGSNAEIKQFCTLDYGVTFPMFSKISVKGDDQDPLYALLTSETGNPNHAGPITWNFNKFLIDQNGTIVDRFDTKVKPDDPKVVAAIERTLAEGKPTANTKP